MAEILARCGYRCDLCPGYSGNIRSDKDRQATSDGWHKYFGFRIAPEDINCGGCFGDNEPLDKECPVRPCVLQRGLDNCGYCPDMPCEKLKTRMDFIEQYLGDLSGIPKDDYDRFLMPYLSKDRLVEIHAETGEK